ncbi:MULTISPECIES: 2-succinyl-5-enolpyruvyl-6-hydroxy-3-cyclohexene-1-carboxylic-acid synthase [Paenarthrobacter]|uniref:2-succinyl-5-enolpyruvyl-6-hydroxy-3-cyclohexene-1-carboxylate synthase n=1 Tax=Paenarthrobacter ureafaciens TaxID=37931 RepID=A0AAX3EF76_PAEUR|nr:MULTISPECIES: 2-succinyl-5-enolpyruvyl-6-hydroxy-3-cyclohexene-1-carboxylic-acid synthase [Paenarthrobacter]NKR10224.1 2-succinyl-5-enolpyruvyl-6-hydroxy-3-cyclohexene-1-carboxylate synthase [Arthrobacter sp. M5]NKR14473.1 2-succinyl-5-enolpyruvyl-6-hydroxy-3-cyclohexene-1-carboxylate synthase [Arthrobacter sp. M6]OEH60368.1 2-succinyl-5-enolpyruvyl-6-hydroxy-3-cyclohexene-1-carboxylate synthase [Arthrobacter sp. D4]OEH60983.1 2-succinyl-5-enolpyruvyl-6-hydroxy-3-cyclohexene-1-carboxylate sy
MTSQISLTSLGAARIAVTALLDGGVRHVVVAPGSRSAPMAYALAEAEAAGRVHLHVRIDERDAGFTGLGLALSTEAPAAVLTTSGTAVGNLLPAVMEANHAAVPLIVISADRPAELHGTGANQTTTQLDLFGDHVRFAVDVAAGDNPQRAVATALYAATGALEDTPPGPVQVNLAFRDPLVPEAGDALPTAAGHGLFHYDAGPQALDLPEASAGLPERRTVVLAGHDAGPVAEAFARAHGLPLLAEPSSNARFGPNSVGPYRLLLEHFGPESPAPIERVVLFGRPTLSRPVGALLAREGVESVIYQPVPVAWYQEGRRREAPVETLPGLGEFAGRGSSEWLDSWLLAGAAAQHALDGVLAEGAAATGPSIGATVWKHARGKLVLGSSNGIRDVDLAGQPHPDPIATVYANRGLAGIDGTLATATGIALGSGRETTVLLGDVTFLHDVGGLLLGKGEPTPDLRIVVLNDAGGAIFGLLEHGAVEDSGAYGTAVERLFGTPHAVDLSALAAAYGVGHQAVSTTAELAEALKAPLKGRSIVEVRADRVGLRGLHARIKDAVSAAVGKVLAA